MICDKCIIRIVFWLMVCAIMTETSKLPPALANMNNIYARSITSSAINSNLMESITTGAKVAYDHCQKAFKWNRWNCPESAFGRKFKNAPTKETAYTKAILSAGIVHTITKNCSRGELEGCGCDPELGGQSPVKIGGRSINQEEFNRTELKPGEPVQWTWGGCSDHIKYGSQIAQIYLDELENPEELESGVHLHNNQIGRDIVKETMIKRCVCHGVSGSCQLQTCWMQVAPFDTIAEKLKQKFSKSIQINIESDNSAEDHPIVEIPEDNYKDLIYIDESPDYCKASNLTGTKGVKGRACSRSKLKNATPAERRSCRNLCRSCGYRVKKQKRVVHERCNCNFKWCCEVTCDICTKTIEEYTCE